MQQAEIGVFGGSGFYAFLDKVQEVKVDTPYGPPSGKIALGELSGRKLAFLPRHGKDHTLPPHMIPYRANLWAMKELGVTRIIAPCAAGSLKAEHKPGDFVLCDQFIDRTSGRMDTFYNGPIVTHVSTAHPYCPELREVAFNHCQKLAIPVHQHGTMVIIQGPRFSTQAESRWFSAMGWGVVNMTGYPEVALARELGMCYVNISLITDYDAGLENEPGLQPVTSDEVVAVFNSNLDKLKQLLFSMFPALPGERSCDCAQALDSARV